MRTLVVTNDFPPRAGGIQAYLHALLSRQPADEVVVHAPAWRGDAEFDAQQPFPVVRDPSSLMLPVPGVLGRARDVLRTEGCDRVWFGAAAPLGLLAAPLRRAGAGHVLASTHGHEIGWAMLPGARQALRRIGDTVDVATALTRYTRDRVAGGLGPHPRLEILSPGVDATLFHPGQDGAAVRRRHGLGDRPVVVCASRLVARKGQDVLVRALPEVRRRVPGAALLLVGGGPDRAALARLARDCGVERDVVLTGGVPWEELPAHYAAGDVFAMPCRTRRAGMDVEGLGIVFLEASATGLPVVAGDSGGAPEAVREGETGRVVRGRDVAAVAAAVSTYLEDPALAARTGQAGRRWVETAWRWEDRAAQARALLASDGTGGA